MTGEERSGRTDDWLGDDAQDTEEVPVDARRGPPGPRPPAPTQSLPRSRGSEDVPELDSPSFPIALRGYERVAVDLYIARLRQRIAGLEAVRTPETIMRRALEQVGEETSGILRQAQQTAADMAARSRAQADDRLERAKRDADEVRVSAEMRVRQLDTDTDTVWRERSALVDDVRKLSSQLQEVAERAERRYPAEEEHGAAGRTGGFEAIGGEGESAEGESAEGESATSEEDHAPSDELPDDAVEPVPTAPDAEATRRTPRFEWDATRADRAAPPGGESLSARDEVPGGGAASEG